MSHKSNSKFVIMNKKGFVIDPDTGSPTLHHSAQAAMKFMKPYDTIVPIESDEQLEDYKSGKIRMPILNRSNARL